MKRLDSLNQNNVTCFHIDGTYKITRPIAFMLTSHEEENDFKYFYDSIIGLVSKLNFNFKVKMYICTE